MSSKRLCQSALRTYCARRFHSNEGRAVTVRDEADVVIIGGGVIGVSVAYHLTKLGINDVVLLEKSELTAGSTWHAAGLVTYYNNGVNNKRLHYDSIQLYSKLAEETGQEVGFHTPGSLRLATNPTRVDEMRYQMSRHGWHQAPQRIISPDEIAKIHPLLNVDKILAGLYNPGDGHIDPYSLTQALAIGARRGGAQIVSPVAVVATNQRADGGWDVETNQGRIKATHIVNATGFWGREIAQLAGFNFPLIPVHHTYLVTSSLPEVEALERELPVIRDLDAATYVRQERSGLIVGPYESEEKMKLRDDWYDNGVPVGFGKELFDSNIDDLQDNLEKAMEIFPALERANIVNVICGPMTYTPDILPMIGPCQGRSNYWAAVGFGYGIVHAGGAGRYLAHWMRHGEPPYDLIENDPNRYGAWTNRSYTFSKARESYGLNTAVVYPKDERLAGRPADRPTPLYAELKYKGAQFGFRSGWEQPNWFAKSGDEAQYKPSFRRTNWFEPVRRECEMVREKAGVIDLSSAAKYQIMGRDAENFCDYIYASDLPQVWSQSMCPLLTQSGRVYGEHLVVRLGTNQFFCVTGAGSELHDLRWMEDVVRQRGYEVKITNVTESTGCIGLAGPMSQDLVPELANNGAICQTTVGGVQVLAIKGSLTGELGFEIYPRMSDVALLYGHLMQIGEKHGLCDFGSYAYNSLRLEAGNPVWGSEMKIDYNALESNLHKRVNLNKSTDYIGKEAIQELQKETQKKTLVLLGVKTSDYVDPEGNETIWCRDEVVGNATSGCYSYHSKQSLAFAYIPPKLAYPGNRVDIELLGNRCPATVLKTHPVKRKDTYDEIEMPMYSSLQT